MDGWLFFFLLAVTLVSLFAFVYTYRAGFKQTSNKDEEVSEAQAKHKVLLNPIFITYVLFLVAITVGSILFYYIFYGGR